MKITKAELLKPTMKIAIHAPTKVDAKKLMEWYDKRGKAWCGGMSSIKKDIWGYYNYNNYKSKTCYNHTLFMSREGAFGDLKYYNGINKHVVITVKEFFEILNSDGKVGSFGVASPTTLLKITGGKKPRYVSKWDRVFEKDDIVVSEIYITINKKDYNIQEAKELYSKLASAIKKYSIEFE